MRSVKTLAPVLLGAFVSQELAADSLKDIFETGTVSGNLRAYYYTRDYDTREDEAAFSLGGALKGETGTLGFVKFGLGYYTAQDMGTNDDDPLKVNSRLGSDLEVLGESYIKASGWGTDVVIGRQKIDTPWANAGDAFMIPFTFKANSIVNTSIPNLKLEFDYISEIKNRNSDEFVDVGKWNAARFGVLNGGSSDGTINLGAQYKTKPLNLELWLTRFSDYFDTAYGRGDYTFNSGGSIQPFIGIQYAMQTDSGDALLGDVDSTLYGLQGGAGFGKFKVTLGYNTVAEEQTSFRNGAFLAPYSFATSPLFTNNMLETFENVDSGDAGKITLNYSPIASLAIKLSFATFDFDNVVDRDATDFDITYSFDGYLAGLSLRWRIEIVDSDSDVVSQTNNRFMVQYAF